MKPMLRTAPLTAKPGSEGSPLPGFVYTPWYVYEKYPCLQDLYESFIVYLRPKISTWQQMLSLPLAGSR